MLFNVDINLFRSAKSGSFSSKHNTFDISPYEEVKWRQIRGMCWPYHRSSHRYPPISKYSVDMLPAVCSCCSHIIFAEICGSARSGYKFVQVDMTLLQIIITEKKNRGMPMLYHIVKIFLRQIILIINITVKCTQQITCSKWITWLYNMLKWTWKLAFRLQNQLHEFLS